MFTGLIQRTGRITNVSQPHPTGPVQLLINTNPPIQGSPRPNLQSTADNTQDRWPGTPRPEESVAVDGCCLTVTQSTPDNQTLAFDIIPQTLALTTLGQLKPGDHVNLEQCVPTTGLLGGHIVQGHIDGVAHITHIQTTHDWRVRVQLPNNLIRYATPKGSITLAGVSLTIASIDIPSHSIEVALIPTTLQRTTLGQLKTGQPINVEMDHIAKTVVHYLENFTNNNLTQQHPTAQQQSQT